MECAVARLHCADIHESQAPGATEGPSSHQQQAVGQATRFPLESRPAANPQCANATTAENTNSAQRLTASRQDLLRPFSIRVEIGATCSTECPAAREFEFAGCAFRDICGVLGFSSSKLWNGLAPEPPAAF